MTNEERRARVVDLFETVINGRDADAIPRFTTNPRIAGTLRSLLGGFSDLRFDVRWTVVEGGRVVAFVDMSGTHDSGPWLMVPEPTHRSLTASLVLALELDDEGMVVDTWLGTTSSPCSISSDGASPHVARSCPGNSAPVLARIEVEEHAAALEVSELDGVAVLIERHERWCLVTRPQGHAIEDRSATRAAVDELTEDVRVSGMTSGLLEEVSHDPPQIYRTVGAHHGAPVLE